MLLSEGALADAAGCQNPDPGPLAVIECGEGLEERQAKGWLGLGLAVLLKQAC